VTDTDDALCHGYALAAARGDLAVYLALRALRKVEQGRAGRELGVMDTRANTYELQVRWAANTVRHYEHDATDPLTSGFAGAVRDPQTGLYTADFLTYASHRYAPVGADNDPTGLNANHAGNLRILYAALALQVTESLAHAIA
jgi:hypothetical protein